MNLIGTTQENFGYKVEHLSKTLQVNKYSLKLNNRITRKRCEICPKLAIKLPKRICWYRSGVLIVTFEHVDKGNKVDKHYMGQ